MGTQELLIILGILILLFGAKKLPELSKSLGQSIREFRKGQESAADDDTDNEAASRDAGSEES
jgi:sec-independent protein translocase protein TatA